MKKLCLLIVLILILFISNNPCLAQMQEQVKPEVVIQGGADFQGPFAFSHDNKLLAASCANNSIAIINIHDKKIIKIFYGHTDTITSLLFSPNSKLFASKSKDNTLKIWSIDSLKLLYDFGGSWDIITYSDIVSDYYNNSFKDFEFNQPETNTETKTEGNKTTTTTTTITKDPVHSKNFTLWKNPDYENILLELNAGTTQRVIKTRSSNISTNKFDKSYIIDKSKHFRVDIEKDNDFLSTPPIFSYDSKLLAIGDVNGSLKIYNLENGEFETESGLLDTENSQICFFLKDSYNLLYSNDSIYYIYSCIDKNSKRLIINNLEISTKYILNSDIKYLLVKNMDNDLITLDCDNNFDTIQFLPKVVKFTLTSDNYLIYEQNGIYTAIDLTNKNKISFNINSSKIIDDNLFRKNSIYNINYFVMNFNKDTLSLFDMKNKKEINFVQTYTSKINDILIDNLINIPHSFGDLSKHLFHGRNISCLFGFWFGDNNGKIKYFKLLDYPSICFKLDTKKSIDQISIQKQDSIYYYSLVFNDSTWTYIEFDSIINEKNIYKGKPIIKSDPITIADYDLIIEPHDILLIDKKTSNNFPVIEIFNKSITTVSKVIKDSNNLILAIGLSDGSIIVRNLNEIQYISDYNIHHNPIKKIYFDCMRDNKNYNEYSIMSIGEDGNLKIHNYKNNRNNYFNIYFIDSCDYIISTHDNYYTCSKGAYKGVAFRVGNRAYPFEQFDLRLNRPDIVLEQLGYASKETIDSARKTYYFRLKLMDVDTNKFRDDYRLPEIEIANLDNIQQTSETDSVVIHIKAKAKDNSDTTYLERLNVYVNEVPVYGMKGLKLTSHCSELDTTVKIQLSKGENKFLVSVNDSQSTESLRQPFTVSYNPKITVKPKLYLLSVGVNRYKNIKGLEYCVSDARLIDSIFKLQKGKKYSDVINITLTNEKATRDKILDFKKTLMQSNVDDYVILFFSGHGDTSKLESYFATYDIELKNKDSTALSFTNMLSLTDGIPARNKLILIDACYSGEVYPKNLENINYASKNNDKTTKGNVKSLEKSPPSKEEKPPKVLTKEENPYAIYEKMEELFTNLRPAGGAIVLTAARGNQYAREDSLKNQGIFTYFIKEGLLNGKADFNNNKEITASELLQYVKTAIKLSSEAQMPEMKRGKVEFDFPIFVR